MHTNAVGACMTLLTHLLAPCANAFWQLLESEVEAERGQLVSERNLSKVNSSKECERKLRECDGCVDGLCIAPKSLFHNDWSHYYFLAECIGKEMECASVSVEEPRQRPAQSCAELTETLECTMVC